MKKTLLQLSTLLLCFTANAQSHVDSFDLAKGSTFNGSYPGGMVTVGNALYFTAMDSIVGTQLWAFYSGDKAPKRLSNFDKSKTLSFWGFNEGLPIIDGTIYFSMMDSTHGGELWFFNRGGGYAMVKDIMPGTSGSFPMSFATHNKVLYFGASDSVHGNELWHHIPATNVTERLTDLYPGSMGSMPSGMTAFNNKIYFTASDSAHGAELFEYDPATKATRLVADINPGTMPSSVSNFCVMDNKLYFSAFTQANGIELWSYDGTAAPKRVTDLGAGNFAGMASYVTPVVYKNKLYFSGSFNNKFELACYDPATDKATMVHSINPAPAGASISNMIVYNNLLFFTANDGTGIEIWKYDGSATPSSVTNLSTNTGFRTFSGFAATPHELFFSATSNVIGQELFRLSFNKLGVENVAFKGEVAIYPNPATDAANIQMKLQESQSLTISVTDMNGRIVYTTSNVLYSAATHTVNIPMRNLPSGTYTYHISNTQGSLMNSGKLQKL